MHHLIFTKDISIKRYKSQKEGKKEGKQRIHSGAASETNSFCDAVWSVYNKGLG